MCQYVSQSGGGRREGGGGKEKPHFSIPSSRGQTANKGFVDQLGSPDLAAS